MEHAISMCNYDLYVVIEILLIVVVVVELEAIVELWTEVGWGHFEKMVISLFGGFGCTIWKNFWVAKNAKIKFEKFGQNDYKRLLTFGAEATRNFYNLLGSIWNIE